MSEQDENGNPLYSAEAEDTRVTFDAKYATLIGNKSGVDFVAAGPEHRTGSGWIVHVDPIRTRKGDIEPVYTILVHILDGEVIPEDKGRRYILLGEPEITRAYQTEDA